MFRWLGLGALGAFWAHRREFLSVPVALMVLNGMDYCLRGASLAGNSCWCLVLHWLPDAMAPPCWWGLVVRWGGCATVVVTKQGVGPGRYGEVAR